MKKERIDKVLASQTMYSRSEIARLCSDGSVLLNGIKCKASEKFDPESDSLSINGEQFAYKPHIYLMLNKPQGFVSSTNSDDGRSVLDLVPDRYLRPGLFPAGRLDKDTTGFLLLTDDGAFAHEILSPKKHVKKTYIFTCSDELSEKSIAELEKGIILGDESFKPAEIAKIDALKYRITITEGKYHEIKRMMEYTGSVVTSLKRISIGSLDLDPSLSSGECRELTTDELAAIKR